MTEKNHSAAAAALIAGSSTLRAGRADVFRQRERTKRKRLIRAIVVVASLDVYLWWRYSSGRPLRLPTIPEGFPWEIYLPGGLLIIAIGLMIALPLMTGRSPHITVYPEQVEVGLTDVTGLNLQVDEVIRTLDVFLGYGTFRDELGGTPRQGDPVRGAARDGQDLSREGDGEAGGGPVPVHLGLVDDVDVPGHDRLPHPVVLQGTPEGRAQGRGRDRLHRGDRRDRRVEGSA